jgi:hypothetical protein
MSQVKNKFNLKFVLPACLHEKCFRRYNIAGKSGKISLHFSAGLMIYNKNPGFPSSSLSFFTA